MNATQSITLLTFQDAADTEHLKLQTYTSIQKKIIFIPLALTLKMDF